SHAAGPYGAESPAKAQPATLHRIAPSSTS
ncbi:unnamed protein product, partial [marine sediment metagenome]